MYRIIPLLFSVSILFSCSKEENNYKDISIFCNAENVKDGLFIVDTFQFSGGGLQSSDFSKSGKYSVKLNEDNPFGFSYKVTNVKEGDVIKTSVWKFLDSNGGSLVVSAEGKENRYYHSNETILETENNWGRIESYFFAPEDIDTVTIYVFNTLNENAFFDDINIHVYSNIEKPKVLEDVLVITLPEIGYDSIRKYRQTAINQGLIRKGQKEYVDAFIQLNGEKVPVKLRLKGDLSDHLETNKWSFRIKVKGQNVFNGMKSFSIQHPHTRSFMKEWFAHKIFEKEDVLATRYQFISVIINGENKGVYALEEHFDKYLLENQGRREGPIVKFDESGLWERNSIKNTNKEMYSAPIFDAAIIIPFKKGRTYKTSGLNKQFQMAQDRMENFRQHSLPVNDYFEVKQLAKYLALIDVLNGSHAIFWNNQRHYYNPVTNKLEPIAYDFYGSTGSNGRIIHLEKWLEGVCEDEEIYAATLKDPKLNKLYFQFLKKFSNPDYLATVFNELKSEIDIVESLLQIENPFYSFDKEILESNCTSIRKQLLNYSTEDKLYYAELLGKPSDALPKNILFPSIALNVYTESRVGEKTTLSLRNYHSSSIDIVGYLDADKNEMKLDKTYVLDSYDSVNDESLIIIIQGKKPKVIVYKAENCGDSLFYKKIGKWPSPNIIEIPKYYSSNDTIIFKTGRYTFKEDIFIPADRVVIFEKGVSMDLINNAAFVSYSTVKMNGTENEPINIYSSDKTANGFVVIAEGKKVVLNYCYFDNLNTMRKNNWILTGGVTIYEGDIQLNHCKFTNNHCEDGLNLIRSNFTMKNCLVENTFSDGFDADFCTGKISNSNFTNTGNDCLDFSGSKIEIVNCLIENSGDKGISGGENSELKIKDCSISNAEIGIAAKDLSRIEVSNVQLKECNYAFAAYRKKPEFGPAEIIVTSINENSYNHLYLLEKDSKLTYINEDFIGTEVFNIDSMYLQFKK